MWLHGIKVNPIDMLYTADGLSQMLAGFLRKQGINLGQCRDGGEEDIAARLREITWQAEGLARLLATRIEEAGTRGVAPDDLDDIRVRFLLLVLRAHNLMSRFIGLSYRGPSIAVD